MRRGLLLAWLACWICLAGCAARAEIPLIDTSAACPFDEGTPLFEAFFLNLGLGNDGFLLRCGGETLLIDGGEAGCERAVEALLAEQGLERLDMMLNTHGDADHIDGAVRLLRDGYGVSVFLSPYRPDAAPSTYDPLFPLLEEAGAAFVTVGHGDILALGDARVFVYRDDDQTHGANARSLVLKVKYGERVLLLMADASGVGQRRLLEMLEPEDLRADVFKVAHHGITPSVPNFLNVVRPLAAVVTNGRDYVAETVRQLEYRAIDDYYTAEGTVYMATDGASWWICQP